MKTCIHCRFYDSGRCRFLPPSFFFNGQYVHPKVGGDDWCGQFHPLKPKLEFPQQEQRQSPS